MKKLPWYLLLFCVLIVIGMVMIGVWVVQEKTSRPSAQNTAETLLDERSKRACGLPSAETVAAQEQVSILQAGFDRLEVSVKVGQTVRWINTDTSTHRVVSGPHPLHDTCYGLDSGKMNPNDSFGFTFTKPGEWMVHDEQNTSNKSHIIVTE